VWLFSFSIYARIYAYIYAYETERAYRTELKDREVYAVARRREIGAFLEST